MVIKVNKQIVVTDFSSALPTANASAIKQFTTSSVCKTKIYYSGPAVPINIYGPGMTLKSVPLYTYLGGNGSFEYDVMQAGIWSVVMVHNKTSTTTLSPYTLDIRSYESSSCQNLCSNSVKSLRLSEGTSDRCITNCSNVANVAAPSTKESSTN